MCTQLRAKYAHLLKTQPASAESGPAVTGAGSAAAAGEAPEAAPPPAAKPLQPADSASPPESAPAAPLSATAGAASGGTVGVVEAWRKRKEHRVSAARVVRARRAPQKAAVAPSASAGAFRERTNAHDTDCSVVVPYVCVFPYDITGMHYHYAAVVEAPSARQARAAFRTGRSCCPNPLRAGRRR